jgi:hypothetical protein
VQVGIANDLVVVVVTNSFDIELEYAKHQNNQQSHGKAMTLEHSAN